MTKTLTLPKLIVFTAFWLVGCASVQAQQSTGSTAAAKTGYTYKIINAANHTYGYDIYNRGTLVVHQPVIPGAQGLKGFATPQAAVQAAIKAIETKSASASIQPNPLADKPNSK